MNLRVIMQKTKRRYPFFYVPFLGICLTVLISLASASQQQSQALTFCAPGEEQHFNPALKPEDPANLAYARLIFDRLLEFREGTFELHPGLAESYSFSSDAKSITLNLRRKVRFHTMAHFQPTRYFNADDVLFTFARITDNEHPLHGTYGTEYADDVTTIARKIEQVVKLDRYTVRIDLRVPDISALYLLALDSASIISAEYAEAMIGIEKPEVVDRIPIGTGAYRLAAHFRGTLMNLRDVPESWHTERGSPNILITPIEGEDEWYTRSKASQCDIIPPLSAEKAEQFASDPDYKILRGDSGKVITVAINTRIPDLNNAAVRQGMAMSVNKSLILDTVFERKAALASSLLSPSSWAHHSQLQEVPYSVSESRSLLLQAIPDELEINLWVPDSPTKWIDDPDLLGEILKADWTTAGLEINIVKVSQEEMKEVLRNPDRNGAIIFTHNGIVGDPGLVMETLIGCEKENQVHPTHWCNVIFETFLEIARTGAALADQQEIYFRAQEVLAEELPMIPIAYPYQYTAIRREVQNYVLNPLGIVDLRLVTIVHDEPSAE